MSITLTGSGGLFTRLGKLFGTWRDVVSAMDALNTNLDDVADAYDGDRRLDVASLLAGSGAMLEGFAAPFAYIQTAARATLLEQVNADNPLAPKTLEQAVRELVDQMTAASATVNANAVTTTPAAGSGNSGTGGCVATPGRTSTSDAWENAFAEDIAFRCTADGQVDTTLDGVEEWSIDGENAEATSSRRWPADGSGASGTTTTVCGSTDAGTDPATNSTTNGDFETWTVANTPDNWTIATGAAGVTVFQSSTALRGTYSVRLEGDGATLVKLTQTFGSAGGTTARLKPSTWYALSFWVRHNGSAPASGVCRVSVQDASNTVLWSSSSSFNASTLTGSWVQKTVMFRTGADVAATHRVTIEMTTAIDSGKGWLVDECCVAEMRQVYDGGPHVAIFAGAASFVVGDQWTVAVANDNGGKFQTDFQRFFDLNGMGLVLPSDGAGSETISDSLVS